MNILTSAVICAAGSGSRMRAGMNKVLLNLGSHPVLYYTLKIFEESSVDEVIVVTSPESLLDVKELVLDYGFKKVKNVILGGTTRQESVYKGLAFCEGEVIAIHDGARPLVDINEVEKAIELAKIDGAVALGMECKDTIKTVDANGYVVSTLDRASLMRIATPQVFRRDIIINAHELCLRDGVSVTDDCAVAEHSGAKVKIIPSSSENIKLTTPEDMIIAEKILSKRGCLE